MYHACRWRECCPAAVVTAVVVGSTDLFGVRPLPSKMGPYVPCSVMKHSKYNIDATGWPPLVTHENRSPFTYSSAVFSRSWLFPPDTPTSFIPPSALNTTKPQIRPTKPVCKSVKGNVMPTVAFTEGHPSSSLGGTQLADDGINISRLNPRSPTRTEVGTAVGVVVDSAANRQLELITRNAMMSFIILPNVKWRTTASDGANRAPHDS